jgi:replicative DNA helicase
VNQEPAGFGNGGFDLYNHAGHPDPQQAVPPPDHQLDPDGTPPANNGGYWHRLVPGDVFLLDPEPDPAPIWGDGAEVLWAPGEPCLVTGPVGVGKTTLVGRLTRGRLGLEPQVLGYRVTPGARRLLYLACDRPRQIRRNLARMMRPDDREVLADRLVVWPGPPPADLAQTTSLLLDMCRKADADTVVIDGLKDIALELSKDDVGARLNMAFQRCVADGVEVIGNHHQRKTAGGAAAKPRNLADLYGSTWIAAGAGTIILVWADQPGRAVIEVSTLKPAYEPVGPLQVVHDLDTGGLEVRDAITLEEVLRSSRGDALSLTELAERIGQPLPPGRAGSNEREALRRKMHRLERVGAVDVLEVPSLNGGSPEKRWLWRAR